MNNAVKLQIVAGAGQATADLLQEQAERLRGLETDIRAELRTLNKAVSTERGIGDDRFVTLGAKVEALQDDVRGVTAELRGFRDELRVLLKAVAAQGGQR